MNTYKAEISTGEIDRIAPTRRPLEGRAGYQVWTNLLFVHWRVPVHVLRPLLPPNLTIDEWDGSAWVGLVPFQMSGVRPWWFPAIPGVSRFLETNVRTYVHLRGRDPGVWFFSLDASKSLPALVARWRWRLPYFRSEMMIERRGNLVSYDSQRRWPGNSEARCQITAEVGPLIGEGDADRPAPSGNAIPGTLEHFLFERYLLYAQLRNNALYTARVHHIPYPIREGKLVSLDETLVEAAGIAATGSPAHVGFSDGISVEVFPLRRVSSSR